MSRQTVPSFRIYSLINLLIIRSVLPNTISWIVSFLGCDELQRTALHLAASRGFTDIVAQLLKYGANPNQKDLLGNTPLHLAVCSASSINFNMTVRILLNHGSSVRCTDKMGRNPLDLANRFCFVIFVYLQITLIIINNSTAN